MSVSMENSENKEIVTICVSARTNVHPCQFSQVFEHEIIHSVSTPITSLSGDQYSKF